MRYRIVKLIEAERRMMDARSLWGRINKELLFNRDKISVMQDE